MRDDEIACKLFSVKFTKRMNVHDCITAYVNRMSRRVHLIPLKKSETADDVGNAFSNFFRHLGMSDNIVSFRHPQFNLNLWTRLTEHFGLKLKSSLRRHPQTDGISDIVNRMVENNLRSY